MAAKALLIFCAQVLLVTGTYSQCIPGGPYIDDFILPNLEPFGYGPFEPLGYPGGLVPTNGGIFAVTSFSPIAPTGIMVLSENSIDGFLSVVGELPFLGAVALDGSLPTVGAGGINYGCGNGNVAIISEGVGPVGPVPIGFGPSIGYGPGLGGPLYGVGYGPDLAGLVGCGIVY